jgi:hypothetical protein
MLISRRAVESVDPETFVHRDGTRTLTADWVVGGYKIRDVTNPSLPQDVATKNYVDGLLSGAVTVQTVDATPTDLWSWLLPDDTAVSVRANVSAQESGGANRAGYQLMVVAYRASGGPATILGNTLVVSQQESDGSWDVDFVVAGNQLFLRVTGAATTIDWSGIVERVQAP